jgi:hypothetical protein
MPKRETTRARARTAGRRRLSAARSSRLRCPCSAVLPAPPCAGVRRRAAVPRESPAHPPGRGAARLDAATLDRDDAATCRVRSQPHRRHGACIAALHGTAFSGLSCAPRQAPRRLPLAVLGRLRSAPRSAPARARPARVRLRQRCALTHPFAQPAHGCCATVRWRLRSPVRPPSPFAQVVRAPHNRSRVRSRGLKRPRDITPALRRHAGGTPR